MGMVWLVGNVDLAAWIIKSFNIVEGSVLDSSVLDELLLSSNWRARVDGRFKPGSVIGLVSGGCMLNSQEKDRDGKLVVRGILTAETRMIAIDWKAICGKRIVKTNKFQIKFLNKKLKKPAYI